MLIEIEETVRFLAAFLIGKVPRRRLDEFVEILANLLVKRFESRHQKVWKFVVNAKGSCDAVIDEASKEAQVNAEKMRALWPSNLILELQAGMITAINAVTGATKTVYPSRQQLASGNNVEKPQLRRKIIREAAFLSGSCSSKERIQMHVVWTNYSENGSCEPENRPLFESGLQDKLIYTAQCFASTRFGSTKQKSHQNFDMGCGFHPFTSPSVFAYIQLLQLLNKIGSSWPDAMNETRKKIAVPTHATTLSPRNDITSGVKC